MKSVVGKSISIVLFVCLICVVFMNDLLSVNANEVRTKNRMNVVFVLDQSGSMGQTDPSKLRYEAVDLFLGLSAESGNYMGAVVFDHEIVLQKDITVVDGSDGKTELSDSIKSATSRGDTDIGKAIEAAVDMLVTSGNPELTSTVILLSDGNTDLPGDKNGEKLNQSKASKARAIEIARERGINIHSVCLNINGAAKVSELEDISNSTGGTCVEIRNAGNLKDVFTQFYNIIYSTQTINLADSIIGTEGFIEIPFEIPLIGVEEANIIINTLNEDTTYTMFTPDGTSYSMQELEDITLRAKTFSIIKIQKPVGGEWRLLAKGITGDQIRVDMVYNVDLALEMNLNEGVLENSRGQDVSIEGVYVNNGLVVDDPVVYEGYPIQAIVTDVNTGLSKSYELQPDGDKAELTLTMDEVAEYEIHLVATVEDMNLESDSQTMKIANDSPYLSESKVTVRKIITPFTKKHTIDLQPYVMDKDDTEFTYVIASSDYETEVVYLENSILNIELKDCKKKGDVNIVISDSMGESVEMNVVVRTFQIMPVIIVAVAILLIVVAVGVMIISIVRNSIPIKGSFYITPFAEGVYGSPTMFDGARGKMYFHRYLDIDSSVDTGIVLNQTYLKAGNKDSNYVYLISKNGYYTEIDPERRNKKIRLDEGMELVISADMELSRGIRITYRKEDY